MTTKEYIYIGSFTFNNKMYYKFGKSFDIFRRDYNEHKKKYEKFTIKHIALCENYEQVEDAFK